MNDLVLGIGGLLGHDGNAALLMDGRLVAASQEERYTRRKHDAAFPRAAILDCLAAAGATPDDVPVCIFAEKPLQSLIYDRLGRATSPLTWRMSRLVDEGLFDYPREARRLLPRARFRYAWHHLSHAAAAYATSPYSRAAFLCVDGKGEDVNATIGVVDEHGPQIRYELASESGIGMLYSLVTGLLGFPSFGSEYKVMGLAPFGEPVFADCLRSFVTTDGEGALRLKHDASFEWPARQAAMARLARHLGVAPRGKAEPLASVHVNLAASIQWLFEVEIGKMARHAQRVTGERHLLFCGGCAQNCVAAGKLRNAGVFEAVFNSPVGGDMGSALGAALLGQHAATGMLPKIDPQGFCLGSLPGPLPEEALTFRVPVEGELHAAVAELLAQGKVVGWARGRMELGARALGTRSILADPRVADMQSTLNFKIKFRESFRPFAPAVLAEDSAAWFDTTEPSDYMQYTAYLRPERRRAMPRELRGLRERLAFRRCEVPSVVHVDYSARLQTVRQDVHPDLHRLITAFKRLTGVPMLINTSLNVSGEPIVRTAQEAWQCLRHTDIDYLVVNDDLIRNPQDRTREQKRAWVTQFEAYA